MIFRIGRLDSQEKVNGWELIEAPSEDKATEFAARLFSQEKNNANSYKFESDYEPVVLGKYKSKEELGYGWKDLTPIKANDKPMPYEMKQNDKVIALDTETTGFLPTDEVLQLTVINGNGKVLFNQYFKPEHTKSWEKAMECNHITPEMVGDKKPIGDYKEQIESMLKGADRIVGYNTGFDMRMLEQNGIEIPKEEKYIDLMIPYAKIKGERNQYGKPKWQKLITCAKDYGFPDADWHNSLADTKATLHCYHQMKNRKQLTELDVKDIHHLVGYSAKERDKQLGKSHGISRPPSSKEQER